MGGRFYPAPGALKNAPVDGETGLNRAQIGLKSAQLGPGYAKMARFAALLHFLEQINAENLALLRFLEQIDLKT